MRANRIITRRKRIIISRSVTYVFLTLLTILVFFPFIYMLLSSFQSADSKIFEIPPRIIPDVWCFQNYIEAFQRMNYIRAFGNTLIILVSNVVLTTCSTTLVAYGFARCFSKAKNLMFGLMLSTMMLPWVVTMVPAFVVFKYLGWLGTRYPLIIPCIGGSAYYVFLFRQYMMGISRNLDEAATIDGANSFRILISIIIPNMKPVIALMVTLSAVGIWNDYLGPSLYLLNGEQHTLALTLKNLKNEYGVISWKLTMSGSVMYTLPLIAVFLYGQKYFVQGLVVSSFK